MKQREITKCLCCDKGIANGGNAFFYRLEIEQFVLDFPAIQRAAGLEMAMGGAAPLAAIMGPDEDIAHGMGERTMMICGSCALNKLPLQVLEGES